MLRVISDDLAEIARNVAEIIWSLLLLSWLNLLVDLYYMLTEGSHENVTKRVREKLLYECFCLQIFIAVFTWWRIVHSRQVSAGGLVNVVLSGHSYIRRLWVYAHRSHRANLGLAGVTSTLSARVASCWGHVLWGHVHVIVPEAGVRPVSKQACCPSVILIHIGENDLGRVSTGEIVREILLLVTELSDRCLCPVLTWPSHSLERVQDVQEINAELHQMLPPYQFWHHRRGFNSALFLPDNMHLKGLVKIVTLWMFLLPDICCCFQMTMDSRQASSGSPVNVVLLGHSYICCLRVYAHRSRRANLGLAGVNINFICQAALTLRPHSRHSPRGGVRPVSKTACKQWLLAVHQWYLFT